MEPQAQVVIILLDLPMAAAAIAAMKKTFHLNEGR